MMKGFVFVFATNEAFDGENIADKKVVERVEQVANDLVRFTEALRLHNSLNH
jgi:hypothetical protein